jgi:hypothetical protein
MEFTTKHIIIVAIVLLLIYYLLSRNEGFAPTTFCSNCQSLSEEQCTDCPNCGYCTDDAGNGKCFQGDPAGAYFHDKCMQWKHRDKERILSEQHGHNPYNCGYLYPYDKRVRLHQQFAANN